jgi:hypothetical protein
MKLNNPLRHKIPSDIRDKLYVKMNNQISDYNFEILMNKLQRPLVNNTYRIETHIYHELKLTN